MSNQTTDEPVDVRQAFKPTHAKEFLQLVAERQKIDASIKDLEKEKRLRTDALVALLAESGHKTVLTPEWRVTFTQGTHTTLSKERLLEQGVSAKIIEKATKSTTYETCTVTAIR